MNEHSVNLVRSYSWNCRNTVVLVIGKYSRMEIEQLKTEIPTEDNSAGKFETQLENIINMESFDREKIQKVIKKVIINGEDNIEIVWNTDDPFFR